MRNGGGAIIIFSIRSSSPRFMIAESSFSRLDYAFARFLGQRSALRGKQREMFVALVAQLSAQQSGGHSCLRVAEEDEALLLASGLVSDSGRTPLVLERNRLYCQRYWFYESRLARQIRRLCGRRYRVADLENVLVRYFGSASDGVDWQREAAGKALTQAFSIVTGGPGTGKTTTVVKILALLLETAEAPLHFALAAPTGKAAMRLQESIGANTAALPCPEQVKQSIPDKVTTVHHLLGSRPPSPYFRHDASSPLAHDLLVVDEASMIDLALMSKLVDALKPGARLILLGDKDQLASVEAGAVLADLTAALPENTLELQRAYRFQGEIKQLADAINRQQGEQAWRLLQNGDSATALLSEDPVAFVVRQYSRYLRLIDRGSEIEEVFAEFNRFHVLCSNRLGPLSVADINHRVEQRLAERRRIDPQGQWYVGRPVLVVENSAAMQLYNGDIGLCLRDRASGQLRVLFMRPDGTVKSVLPGRLPRCETVYAMTIHKSQGSEFESVLLVLGERLSPLLTKELLYTGVTRAKKEVKVVAAEDVFVAAVTQKVLRNSGLAEKLLAPGAAGATGDR